MTDRNQRVKDARGEAAKEIEAYKSKQESEFAAFEKEVRHPPAGYPLHRRAPSVLMPLLT